MYTGCSETARLKTLKLHRLATLFSKTYFSRFPYANQIAEHTIDIRNIARERDLSCIFKRTARYDKTH